MKDDKIYLFHIIECIKNIEDYVRQGEAEFFKSKLIQDAVIRNLEIIGEATKRVSVELKQRECLPKGIRCNVLIDVYGHIGRIVPARREFIDVTNLIAKTDAWGIDKRHNPCALLQGLLH